MDKYVVIVSALTGSVDKCLRIVEGTDMIPIQIRIKDFNMPEGASALVYAKAWGTATRVQTATITGNAIEFTQNKGFFIEGENVLQGRITKDGKDLITFAISVICTKSIVTDDADEINSDPTLLQQLLDEIEALKTGTGIVDTELSQESTNPPQNKVVTAKFDEISEKINAIKPLNAILHGFVPNNADFGDYNSALLQKWVDNLAQDSPALYFPAGVYYFGTPVTLNKAGVGCTIFGDAAPRDFVYISKVTSLPVGYNTTTFYFNKANETLFTQASESPVHLKGIVFLSDTFKWTFDGALENAWNARPSVPYNLFTYEITTENCNALDISKYHHCSIEDCLFYGFSGETIKTAKQNMFRDCKITNCNTAIYIADNDCTCYGLYVSNCVNGIVLGESTSTIFAWDLWIDCCAEYGIKAANNLNGVIDGIIDHINYSAIYAKTSTHLKVDARINRCGMYWSGADSLDALKNDDLDVQFKNYSQAATISIHTCHGCDFNLQTSKRGLADDGEQKYYTPNVMINSLSWRQNNLQIPSTDIAVHDFWQISPAIYKTAHTHAGLVHGANIDKLYRHTENGCYICAYKVNDITYVDVRGVVNNDNITAPFTLFSDVDIALLQDIAPLKIPVIAGNNIFGALTSSDGIIFNYYNISGALANGNSVQGHITSM